jgi:hypothetical protein
MSHIFPKFVLFEKIHVLEPRCMQFDVVSVAIKKYRAAGRGRIRILPPDH